MAHVWRSEVTRTRFDRYQELRRHGNSIAKCARLIGINRDSAIRYEKIAKSITLEDLGTKYDLVKTLWGLLGSEEVKPQYKSSIASLIASLNGWMTRPVSKPNETVSHTREDLTKLVGAWRAETPTEPPTVKSHAGKSRELTETGTTERDSATEPPGSPQEGASGSVLADSPAGTNSGNSPDGVDSSPPATDPEKPPDPEDL